MSDLWDLSKKGTSERDLKGDLLYDKGVQKVTNRGNAIIPNGVNNGKVFQQSKVVDRVAKS